MSEEYKVHPNLVFNFMDNMRMKSFVLIGIDEDDDTMMTFRTMNPKEQDRLKKLVCQWYMEMCQGDEQ